MLSVAPIAIHTHPRYWLNSKDSRVRVFKEMQRFGTNVAQGVT